MSRIRPIDSSLDVSTERSPAPTTPRRLRVGSLEGYHTPRSKSPRLKGLGWLLPGKKPLVWVGLGLLSLAIWHNAPRALEVGDGDRALFTGAERMAEISGRFSFDAQAERIDKLREWGGELKLRYQYDSNDALQPRVKAFCWLKNSTENARSAFQKTNLNTIFDWGIGGKEQVGLVELEKNDRFGDESRVYRVELEGRVLGYSISIRSGRSALYAKIEGIVLQPTDVYRICSEMVERLTTHSPARIAAQGMSQSMSQSM